MAPAAPLGIRLEARRRLLGRSRVQDHHPDLGPVPPDGWRPARRPRCGELRPGPAVRGRPPPRSGRAPGASPPRAGGGGRGRRRRRHLRRAGPAGVLRRGILPLGRGRGRGRGREPMAAQPLHRRQRVLAGGGGPGARPSQGASRGTSGGAAGRGCAQLPRTASPRGRTLSDPYHAGEDCQRHRVVLAEDGLRRRGDLFGGAAVARGGDAGAHPPEGDLPDPGRRNPPPLLERAAGRRRGAGQGRPLRLRGAEHGGGGGDQRASRPPRPGVGGPDRLVGAGVRASPSRRGRAAAASGPRGLGHLARYGIRGGSARLRRGGRRPARGAASGVLPGRWQRGLHRQRRPGGSLRPGRARGDPPAPEG